MGYKVLNAICGPADRVRAAGQAMTGIATTQDDREPVSTSRVLISKRVVLVNSASNMVTWLIRLFVLVWLQQYLLARISEAEYALYPVIASVVAFAPLLTVVLTAGISRYITEAWAKGDDRRVVEIVSTISPVLWLVAMVVLVAGAVFARFIDVVLNVAPAQVADARLMALLMFVSLAVTLATSPFVVGLVIRQQFFVTNILDLTQELLRLSILFLLLFGLGPRVLWVVTASVAALLLVQPLWIALSVRALPQLKYRPGAFNRSLLHVLVSFGAWSFLGRLSYTIRQMADPIILNQLATPFDVTCFNLGSLAPRQIEMATNLARSPLTPVLTTAYATGQSDRLRSIFLRGGRFSLWLSLAPVVPLLVLGPEVWALYVGDRYLAAGTIVLLLVIPWLISGTFGMLPQLAEATGQVRSIAWRGLAVQIFNLALTLVLVGVFRLGAIGSALATMVAGIVGGGVLIVPMAVRMTKSSVSVIVRAALWPGLIPACGSALWMMAVNQVWAPKGWLEVIGHSAAGLGVYVALMLTVALQPEDKKDLRHVLGRLGWIRPVTSPTPPGP